MLKVILLGSFQQMLKERSHNKKVQLVKRFAFPEITLTAMLNTNFECHLHLLSEFWTRTTRRKLRARLSVCVCVRLQLAHNSFSPFTNSLGSLQFNFRLSGFTSLVCVWEPRLVRSATLTARESERRRGFLSLLLKVLDYLAENFLTLSSLPPPPTAELATVVSWQSLGRFNFGGYLGPKSARR